MFLPFIRIRYEIFPYLKWLARYSTGRSSGDLFCTQSCQYHSLSDPSVVGRTHSYPDRKFSRRLSYSRRRTSSCIRDVGESQIYLLALNVNSILHSRGIANSSLIPHVYGKERQFVSTPCSPKVHLQMVHLNGLTRTNSRIPYIIFVIVLFRPNRRCSTM